MATAKCFQCGATAQAGTFEQARKLLDHAIGLARGIKCGDAYGAVREIKNASVPQVKTITTLTKKVEPKVIETKEEPKTIEIIPQAESKVTEIIPHVEPKTEKTQTSRKPKDKKS